MRHKLLFFGLALGLVMVLALTTNTETSFAASPAARPAPATCTATMIGATPECPIYVAPAPGFWDSINIVSIDIGSMSLSVDLGPGYFFQFDANDIDKVEIKNNKIEIKGSDFKLEVKDGKVELKTGDLKLKIKAGNIPHGKAWGWWKKNGGYVVIGWTYVYNGELVFQVPEGADDDPEMLDYAEFRKMVLANYLTTYDFAAEFDELIGGEFVTYEDANDPEVTEWRYWSPNSGSILLGWVKLEGDKLVYAVFDGTPISEDAFLDYVIDKLNVKIEIKVKVN
jgi:hypothetical protein